MPTLTVAGHDVTVGDEFLKLSKEDQQAMVNHIAEHLPSEKPSEEPSGVGAGFAHGVANVFSGPASTIGLTGAKTDTLDKIAAAAEPSDYKSAPIFDKDGVHLGNIPQAIAEAAPGLTTDVLAGKAGASIGSKVGGVRGGVVGGLGGFLGSALLRNFGPGAHGNADARTGVPNSPVETKDLTREASKQALEAAPNMLLGGRFVPGATKAVAEAALAKLAKTGLIGAGTGVANDVVDQLGTTAGSKEGIKFDPYRTANSAATGALLSTAMASPRAAAEVHGNIKYGGFEGTPEAKAASVDLANRLSKAADGENLVGPTGGTKKGTEVRDRVHAGIHDELSAATKGEDLSVDNASTLKRINEGGTASQSELKSLSDEASPETMRLARLALVSSKLKAMGDTGGASGMMEGLGPIARPGTYIGGAVLGSGIPGIGHLALPALGGVYGTYAAARAMDKIAGLRSPTEGLIKRYEDPSVPIRTPEAPQPPQTTSVPQVAPPSAAPQPWGSPQPAPEVQPSLSKTLTANAKVEEGMARIAKMIQAQKLKQTLAEAKQQAINIRPVSEPAISPSADQKPTPPLGAGLPAEPPPAPVSPVPNAGPPASPAIAALMAKLQGSAPAATAGPEASPVAPAAPVSPLMQKIQASTPENPMVAHELPAPPMIAKINKKLGKDVELTPHPEAPYEPLTAEQLYGRNMSHDEFAAHETAAKVASGELQPHKAPEYHSAVVHDRQVRERELQRVSRESAKSKDDTPLAKLLLQELHHTRTERDANRAIEFYGKHMSKRMRAATAQLMSRHGAFSQMWSK